MPEAQQFSPQFPDIRSDGNKVSDMLYDRAVQFNDSLKYNDVSAWPFWYPSVPFPYLDTDTDNSGLGLLGHTVPAGGVLSVPIITESDTVYHLLNVKYNAYRDEGGGVFTWYDEPGGGTTVQPINLRIFRPLYQFLRVSLIVASEKNTYIYGSVQDAPQTGLIEQPLRVQTLQGIDDGLGMLRTPIQIPAEATVTLKVTNTHATSALITNPCLFGYKIAI